MARTTSITYTSQTSNPLNTQKQFDQYGFPFTLNPTVGCSFACKYCYSPIFVAKVKTGKRKRFFENIRIKLDIPTALDKKLTALQQLPQHLKRVQINETSEYYLPRVVSGLKAMNRDIMGEILDVFAKHAANGNNWMLHILSKSNLILNHIDRFKSMREMVQIEFSFATHDDKIRKQIEFYTIPTSERLRTIEIH
jgi:DNA repair photolyase